MFELDPSLLRCKFIGNIIKEKIKEKGTTISKVSENINSQQSLLSRSLSGKVGVTDDFFIKIMKGIPITEIEMKQIFKEADIEEFKYKYDEELGLEKLEIKNEGQEIVTTVEEAESVLFRKNGIDKPTDEDLLAIRIALDMAKKRREMRK